MKKLLILAASAAAIVTATPAAAAINIPVSGASNTCDTPPADTTPAALHCAGYFDGNVLNQSSSSTISAALSALGATYNGSFGSYTTVSGLNGDTDLTQEFGILTGLQILGIHYGNGGGATALGNVTAFYQIDFGTGATLHLNVPASSSVTLFTSGRAVPEPATWAMMLVGFGGIGAAMRRSRRRQSALMQIA